MKQQEIIERIQKAEHVVVIAHVNPDADSLSSASAVYTYMLKLHKKVSFFCSSKNIDEKLKFLPWVDKIKNSFPSGADLAISLDCGSYARLGVELDIDLINFDHHQSNDNYGTYNIVDESAISTTQVLFDFFKANGIEINRKIATALYAGLIDDSSNFSSHKTDHRVFDMAKELCLLGADSKSCNSFVSQYMSLSAYRLKGAMMLDMQLYANGSIAVLCVDQKMMQKYGAKASDCEAALEEALHLPTVKIAFLLRENKNMSLKASLRSKEDIDVNAIAKHFGGGGHPHAAGFTLLGNDMQKAAQEIITLLKESI
ncbi:DHH family phosphoesterase [Sulfurimonas sp. HSL-1716]|uniref:DHH family phosphoesterase n=1 Tax=Hydrocurvibacter sulfurireducens TaxID=3131937 RepID=UPI0031F8A576